MSITENLRRIASTLDAPQSAAPRDASVHQRDIATLIDNDGRVQDEQKENLKNLFAQMGMVTMQDLRDLSALQPLSDVLLAEVNSYEKTSSVSFSYAAKAVLGRIARDASAISQPLDDGTQKPSVSKVEAIGDTSKSILGGILAEGRETASVEKNLRQKAFSEKRQQAEAMYPPSPETSQIIARPPPGLEAMYPYVDAPKQAVLPVLKLSKVLCDDDDAESEQSGESLSLDPQSEYAEQSQERENSDAPPFDSTQRPQDGYDEVPTIRNELVHPHGCSPCAFFTRPNGCIKGSECNRCHHPDHAEIRLRYRKQRQAARWMRYYADRPNMRPQQSMHLRIPQPQPQPQIVPPTSISVIHEDPQIRVVRLSM